MRYALKLGPVPLSGQSTWVYLRGDARGDFGQPVFADDDREGLASLLEGVDPAELVCEPALGDAARALGLQVAPPSAGALVGRAAIAVFMAWGQRGMAALGGDMVLLFLAAAGEFWGARPWTHWDDTQGLDVFVKGARSHAFEAGIFGSDDGGPVGLALYEEQGALKQLAGLQARGETDAASRLPAIAVSLDARPPYVIDALKAANQAPRMPVPLKSGPDGLSVPSVLEARVLIATLKAVAKLRPEAREASASSGEGAEAVTVRVIAPPPSRG